MRVTVLDDDFEIDETLVDATPEEIRRQLREYERGTRTRFDFDVDFPETFTGRVMAAMNEIPYGETRTYGQLASTLSTSAVAIGGACGRNKVPVVVPCHRVVGADSIGGFSADGGVESKQRLLAHERDEPTQTSLEQVFDGTPFG